ncbi:MAG: bifunctional phosphopantothenoylcysteine decarboxylase/phosphopantothenate--cysteine ligase CoaBC [Leptolyngbya sp. UWPOB_LEPTO1]|uniref:bifunctional phosphopantothenoylcysteine decarboxylase/phosphopantothenate--cysteine ligase CoaBC n=1 Tax=Leptolyngbya sp. UWPOB_LEPTO1 TaxID=2815653 RepID=UPI001AC7FC54|nr:bifunctional phosphopantothenoylcysteine decarboxylase/phosphopantothenate--cysteine ligase CoaBC [Leptolyngbya sp. UWPOB_LEPTO1]MBN8559722.1 bifunctional phosphopantothenoylcysteine decarboxylase/phosphopantothenate--cysteine ligase CoaBC [Leptolyngbya sp. UWPOB_LEPTO1]
MSEIPKRVLIGVGGGIAAYKVCHVVSALAKEQIEVRVILTDSAQAFVTPLTFATLSRNPAYTDQMFWDASNPRPLHIELGEWADLFLIAPLTANTLAKLTYGLADNLLTNTVLASTCPILLAPAMNTDMWEQRSTQRNWRELLSDTRYHSAAPGEGILACDRVGTGRMAEPEELLLQIRSLLQTHDRDLTGKQILVSAGGTREHFDPVRFIGNPSTGKMGIAIAQAALHRGAQVTLVHAPIDSHLLAPLRSIRCIPVTTSQEMQQAMKQNFSSADYIVMSAAVGDVKPNFYSDAKLPKSQLPEKLDLVPIPDILAELSTLKRPNQQLIGFAAQTGDFVTPALEKLHRKNLDVIIANPIDQPNSGFGSDTNQAMFIDLTGRQVAIPPCTKLELAHKLFDFIHQRISCQSGQSELSSQP